MPHPRLYKPVRIANDENEIQIVDTLKSPETRVSIGFAPIDYQLNRTAVRPGIDSYSAFFENDKLTPTGLTGYLRERGLKRVFVCGLATDFCVSFSAQDSRRQGFETAVLLDASRAIDLDGSLAQATARMRDAGVSLVGDSGLL